MELRLLIIFLFVGLFACQTGTTEESKQIEVLKKALANTPSKENRDLLITAYQNAIKAYPNDKATNSPYFTELAKLQVENKVFASGIQTLMQGLADYPSSKNVADNLWLLSSIYEQNIQRPKVASIIKQLYLKGFPNGTHAATAKQGISGNIADGITALGSSMYDETTHKVDYQAANDFPKAVNLYDRIYTQYPNYEKAAQALFLKAFTYDNDLNDKGTARALYEEFLKKYPNDDFADDTQFLLNNLGKNDEEIIKGFKEE